MDENNGAMELASTGGVKLTSQQEHFARLIAVDGLKQSEAYRQAYNVSPDSAPETTWSHASRLAADDKVQARIAELREATQAQMTVSREKIIEELGKVAFADVPTETVKASDKVNALDKISKVAGFYREGQREPQHPIQVTHVTVVLDRGDGRKATEEWDVQAPAAPGVIEGESHVVPENEADSDP